MISTAGQSWLVSTLALSLPISPLVLPTVLGVGEELQWNRSQHLSNSCLCQVLGWVSITCLLIEVI